MTALEQLNKIRLNFEEQEIVSKEQMILYIKDRSTNIDQYRNLTIMSEENIKKLYQKYVKN